MVEHRRVHAGGFVHAEVLIHPARLRIEGEEVLHLVASRQVEDAIFELDAVAEVAVVGTPDEKWIEAITAYVVKKGEIDAEAVLAHVRGRLAPFKVPKAIYFVEQLPRNTAGKILKRELRERFAHQLPEES